MPPPSPTTPDADLLAQFSRARSPDAFRHLVDRHLPMVFAAASRILRDRHLAEDVAQSVFLLLSQNPQKPGTRPLAGWLYQVTLYACSNLQRIEKRRRKREAALMSPITSPAEPTFTDEEVHLDRALAQLPTRLRDTLLLRYVEDHSLAEIAALTRIPVETAKKRLHRALAKLRASFAAQGFTITQDPTLQPLAKSNSSVDPALAAAIATASLSQTVSASTLLLAKSISTTLSLHALAKSAAAIAALLLIGILGATLVTLAAPPPAAPTPPPPVASAPSPPTPTSQPGLPILRIEVAGNTLTDTPTILARVHSQVGQPYNRQQVDADTRSIASMDRFTLANAQFKTVESPDANHKALGINLTFIVEERPGIPPDEQTRTRALIYQLRNSLITSSTTEMTFAAIRSLVLIGKPAVPELCAELDRAQFDSAMRAIVFALREIGDPRAVPALIHALPRSATRTSDFGVTLTDRGLWQFFDDHRPRLSGRYLYPDFGVDRAESQIISALKEMTGQSISEYSYAPGSSDLTHQADVDEWSPWWDQHWKDYCSQEQLDSLKLPARTGDPVEASANAVDGPLFPTGPRIRLGPVHELVLQFPCNCWDTRAFLDLETGRTFSLLEQSRIPVGQSGTKIWSTEAGIDIILMDSYGVISADRARAWLVDNMRWDSLETEIRSGNPLDLGARGPTSYFAPRDPNTGQPVPAYPATFLLRTHDGSPGILQTLAPSDDPSGIKLRYRLFEGIPPPTPHPLPPASPAPKDVTFGPAVKVTLASPRSGSKKSSLSFASGETRVSSNDALAPNSGIPGTLDDSERQWLASWNGDLMPRPETQGALKTLVQADMIVRAVSTASWQHLEPGEVLDILSRGGYSAPTLSITGPGPDYPGQYQQPLPVTYAFKTRQSVAGMLQVLEASDNPPSITLQYKLIFQATQTQPFVVQPSEPPQQPGVSKTGTMRFVYRDASVGDVLNDLSASFGYIVVKPGPVRGRITVGVPNEVNAEQAIKLVNDFIVPLGFKTQETPTAGPAAEQLKMLKLVTLSEARLAETQPAKTVAVREAAIRAGVSETKTMSWDFKDATMETLLKQMSSTFGFVVDAQPISGHVTAHVQEPVKADRAVRLLASVLQEMGYELTESTTQGSMEEAKTILHVKKAEAK